MEDYHASRGFGSLVLAIPALVGEMSEVTVHEAMEEVKASEIRNWTDFFGNTFLARRRKAFQQGRKSEQNLHKKQSAYSIQLILHGKENIKNKKAKIY